MTDHKTKKDEMEQPPVFKSWRHMYWLVLASLAVQILVFYGITQFYK
jgi:hypothetical protein